MAKHIPPRRVPRDRTKQQPSGATKTVSVPPAHTHVEADITDLAHSNTIAVTVSTSAPSGSATDGDLWCRV